MSFSSRSQLAALGLVFSATYLSAGAVACGGDEADAPAASTVKGSGRGGSGGNKSGGAAGEAKAEEGGAAGQAAAGGATGETGGSGVDLGMAGSAGTNGTCAAVSAKAKPRAVSLFVMLDQSGSMIADGKPGVKDPDCNDPDDNLPNTRWKDVTAALRSFAKTPPQGLSMGLGFFPQKNGNNCPKDLNGKNPYALADVPIASLPKASSAIDDALKITPDVCNGTPMLWAMKGAREYTASFAAAHPDELVAIVLATDGIPDGNCSGEENDSDPNTKKVEPSAAEAKAAFTAKIPVRTFVIGVGTDLAALSVIAKAGGTDQAFLVDTAKGGTTAAFTEALDAIRGTVFSCDLGIPKPPNDSAIDPDKINITQEGEGKAGVPLGRVENAAACAGANDGWYYDDPAAPKKVILCPEVCAAVKADAAGGVEVGFGCQTRIADPK